MFYNLSETLRALQREHAALENMNILKFILASLNPNSRSGGSGSTAQIEYVMCFVHSSLISICLFVLPVKFFPSPLAGGFLFSLTILKLDTTFIFLSYG
jgi:hypothetical protein